MSRLRKVRQVLLYTLLLNVIVALAKVIYGYSIDSISMLSDGFHSFFDGTSNVVGLVGIWIASHPPDENHPYGHRKYETLATIAIAVLIFAAGMEILRETYSRIQSPGDIQVTWVSFVIMAITLAVNFSVMTYETKKGRELKSDFLLADALHTRSDIYISLSVIVSLIAAKAGYPVVDIIAALIIVFFIAKMGFFILKSAASVLTDEACIHPDEIRDVVTSVTGVMDCHGIRTRGNESFVNIDLHIQVNPELKIVDAHKVSHAVEANIKNHFPAVIDIVIHTEPYKGRKNP
ncbi:MAG: cation transporter [Nitrospiraceae bacterium]|nr:MAG: cation transporter [Nitrospiraceae bacterium]